MKNRICDLFNIDFPIIQGGMIWCSGWRLASAVSNSGGLGLIGAGSMYPDILREHILKAKENTSRPFGVNVPLIYPDIEKIMGIIIEEKVKIVFTSAGNPKVWTDILHQNGIKVAHVIANSKLAVKCEDAGVDAIVAEGFEAGGHNGREETTTMALIPSVRRITNLPLVAAGGISSGSGIVAALALGADGVQMGSRFVASEESSAHEEFKNLVIQATEGSTRLSLKQLIPVRLLRNQFFDDVDKLERAGASIEELKELLGHGRAKLGMFEGNIFEGELEIGQVSANIDKIESVSQIFSDLKKEFNDTLDAIGRHQKFNL